MIKMLLIVTQTAASVTLTKILHHFQRQFQAFPCHFVLVFSIPLSC